MESRSAQGRRNSVRHLDTETLAARCAEQTALFYQRKSSDELFCYELFRRAILKRDSAAWEALVQQYHPQIERWIQRTGSPDADTLHDLTQDAIVRFWRAYTADQFAKARSLAEILRYWQDCARSAYLDARRKDRAQVVSFDPIGSVAPASPRMERLEDRIALRQARQQLWERVRHHCQDEADRLLAQRIFIEGCKPAQVYREYPQWFVRPTDMYQRLRNLKDRLRRDPLIQQLLTDCS